MTFESFAEFDALVKGAKGPNAEAIAAARARDGVLTKPPGALGRLEDIAIWCAGWQGREKPSLNAPQAIVFAGNHGVTAQGVSAFPAEVTVQMVANFEAGGAAINQLCNAFGVALSVVPLELDRPTADFTQSPAMTEAETVAALKTGWDAVSPDSDFLFVGEMGIGNTTSAAAICAALTDEDAAAWTGRGTGVDDEGLARKSEAVAKGLAVHPSRAPLDVLAALGGREIAAMAGAMARARVEGIPMLLDGFICSSAALVLHKLSAESLDHMIAGHVSAEGAHPRLLEVLGKEPLLSLGLRLGEGSGAAVAMGVLKAALACHSGMATFAEAGVSES